MVVVVVYIQLLLSDFDLGSDTLGINSNASNLHTFACLQSQEKNQTFLSDPWQEKMFGSVLKKL